MNTRALPSSVKADLTLVGITPTSSYARLLPVLLGLGFGMGLLTAAVVAAAVRAVPAERAGLASGVNNTARQAAGALAVAVFGAVTASPHDADRFTSGLHVLGAGSALLWLVALAVTWWTLDRAIRPPRRCRIRSGERARR